jgi:glutamate N-acetyltransferase/amino-acid N-acetyltransferase
VYNRKMINSVGRVSGCSRLGTVLCAGNAAKRGYAIAAASAAEERAKLMRERFVPGQGTYPQGFRIGATHCGIKKNNVLDMMLLVSDRPASAAGVFTQNVFKAAPVQVSKQILADRNGQGIRALILNSGNANAVTGERGLEDAWDMSALTDSAIEAESMGFPSTLVMSTGVIGQNLPSDKVFSGIKDVAAHIGSDHKAWLLGAEAMMTTDTFPKMVSRQYQIGGQTYSIAGLAKGAGMIHPNMATLLGFFATDAPVSADALDKALRYAVARSFNSISVDGDCSTNDTIVAIANGAAGGREITINNEQYEVFQKGVTEIAEDLAKLVVRDGEGATKFVTVRVEDAASFEDAKQIASTIAQSQLVKCALYGKDANWGRILCATGYSGIPVTPNTTSVSFVPTDGSQELKLLVNGEPENVDEDRASEILEHEDLIIRVTLGTGRGYNANYYTCDLTHEYVFCLQFLHHDILKS